MPVKGVDRAYYLGRESIKPNAKKSKKDQYYRWVSQNQANDALKMSVGREVEDGKYKAASAITALAGFAGIAASGISLINIRDKAFELAYKAAEQTEEQLAKGVEKISKQSKIAKGALLASAGVLYASYVIKELNERKADKTANDRGFLTTKDKLRIKDKQVNYDITNQIYNEHLK